MYEIYAEILRTERSDSLSGIRRMMVRISEIIVTKKYAFANITARAKKIFRGASRRNIRNQLPLAVSTAVGRRARKRALVTLGPIRISRSYRLKQVVQYGDDP